MLLKREPFSAVARAMMRRCLAIEEPLAITANTVTDIYYVCRKQIGREHAKVGVAELLDIVDIWDICREDVAHAVVSAMSDFEDAVLVESALRHGARVIVTRNVADFSSSPIPVLTPSQVLTELF